MSDETQAERERRWAEGNWPEQARAEVQSLRAQVRTLTGDRDTQAVTISQMVAQLAACHQGQDNVLAKLAAARDDLATSEAQKAALRDTEEKLREAWSREVLQLEDRIAAEMAESNRYAAQLSACQGDRDQARADLAAAREAGQLHERALAQSEGRYAAARGHLTAILTTLGRIQVVYHPEGDCGLDGCDRNCATKRLLMAEAEAARAWVAAQGQPAPAPGSNCDHCCGNRSDHERGCPAAPAPPDPRPRVDFLGRDGATVIGTVTWSDSGPDPWALLEAVTAWAEREQAHMVKLHQSTKPRSAIELPLPGPSELELVRVAREALAARKGGGRG